MLRSHNFHQRNYFVPPILGCTNIWLNHYAYKHVRTHTQADNWARLLKRIKLTVRNKKPHGLCSLRALLNAIATPKSHRVRALVVETRKYKKKCSHSINKIHTQCMHILRILVDMQQHTMYLIQWLYTFNKIHFILDNKLHREAIYQ